MTGKRILGIVLVLIGVACLLFSNYINNQVGQGRGKIAKAQGQVNMAEGFMSLSPEAKQYGKGMTESAQGQINAGSATADMYAQRATMLQWGGIGLIVIGGLLLIFGGKKSSKR